MERILDAAAEIAAGTGVRAIGTEHVLVALIDDPHGIAGRTSRS